MNAYLPKKYPLKAMTYQPIFLRGWGLQLEYAHLNYDSPDFAESCCLLLSTLYHLGGSGHNSADNQSHLAGLQVKVEMCIEAVSKATEADNEMLNQDSIITYDITSSTWLTISQHIIINRYGP